MSPEVEKKMGFLWDKTSTEWNNRQNNYTPKKTYSQRLSSDSGWELKMIAELKMMGTLKGILK